VGLKNDVYRHLLMTGDTPIRPFGYACIRLYRKLASWGIPGVQRVTPVADYAPWATDQEFVQTYGVIKPYTLVDIYRCYELWSLVAQSAKLEGSILEVGVWRGGSGALIATKAALCGITEKVYLCDTFTGVVKATAQDSKYRGGEHADTPMQVVEELLYKRLQLKNAEILQGVFPDDTGPLVENKRFCLCHVDVDVYQSAKDITAWIWDKMVIGGIMVYDDYGSYECVGVTRWVEEQRPRRDRVIVHNLNGHAVIIKIK
jgi:O-methyltransferase